MGGSGEVLSCGPLFLGHPGGRFSPPEKAEKNTSPMNDFANLRFQTPSTNGSCLKGSCQQAKMGV